jgi:hypothetical protein
MGNRSDLLDVQVRRAFVLRQVIQGKTWAEAATAAVDQFGEEQLPKQWGRKAVQKDVERARNQYLEEVKAAAEDYRSFAVRQLMQQLQNLWPLTTWHTEEKVVRDSNGSPTTIEVERPPKVRATRSVIEIIRELKTLFGVDPSDPLGDPEKTEPTEDVFESIQRHIRQESLPEN